MDQYQVEQLKSMRNELSRFMLMYKFALNELETKIDILKEEFRILHDYNPIENTKSRVKSPESILNKLQRKGHDITFSNIKRNVKDIAGLRITCSFISDIYQISDMLQRQRDLKVLEIKDYIKNPKSNGYRSLHILVEIPVFMSDREEHVAVEIQIRTIAMDFWASLEHKIYYKHNKLVPPHLLRELKEAAESAIALDHKMERLHLEMAAMNVKDEEESATQLTINDQQFSIPKVLLDLLGNDRSKSDTVSLSN
ncbi:GTP pyrophosphokinase [Sporosarcina sp. FSL W7-1283]|uniref:GTP pyrophosphokinase n=1 Tax=Sporosarcina sp. FSL W7-1283 TaxID=2921560 RepID=UPI0030F845B4